jgi:hypothetical protein
MVISWLSMKNLKIMLFCASCSLIFAFPGGAADFNPGGSLSDYLKDLYGGDSNAGLTAFPALNIPLGGRAEGMAGAFAAAAEDVSFLEWNPAGSSLLPKTELALFHNHWAGDTRIEGAAFAFRLGDAGFAAGGKWLYVPFRAYHAWGTRVFQGLYSEAVATLNGSFNFLSGRGFSGLSLGVNLKGAFRFFPYFTGANASSLSAGPVISGSGWERITAAAMADLGLLTRINFLKFHSSRERNFSLALVFRNLGPPADGGPLPTLAAAGLAWQPLKPALLSFDYSVPLNLTAPGLSEKPYWAAGLAVQALSFLSLRCGLLSRGENTRIVLGGTADLGKLSLDLNYTLDGLPRSDPLGRASLGLRFNLGDQGRAAREAAAEALYLLGLEAYARGELDEARRHWEAALEAVPRFEPAAEGLALIARSEALMGRIEEMLSF